MAMSNFPWMRFVSWNTGLGVGVVLTSIPLFAKKPFSRATQLGQLKPPGKTMRFTVCSGAGGGGGAYPPLGETGACVPEPPAQDTRNSNDATANSLPNLLMSTSRDHATVFSGGF